MLKCIMFDLDGTLLPLDEEKFIHLYFGGIGKKFASLGHAPDQIVDAVLKGTKTMRENDGSSTNEAVFWERFMTLFDGEREWFEANFLEFYQTGFDRVKESTTPSAYPRLILDELKKKGYLVILATNPLFPVIATEKRIRWAGLEPDDFAWVTTYERIGYSKPNPGYFNTIMDRFSLKPEECLMVGNDASEDMAAKQLGCDVFLLTDCLNNYQSVDISQFARGSMSELYEFIKALPEVGK